MRNVYEEYLAALDEKKRVVANIERLQVDIYNLNSEKYNAVETGTVNFSDGEYNVKVVKKMSTSVDQEIAARIGFGFNAKYTFDKKAYDRFSVEEQMAVAEALTTKPAKPTFSVERA